MIYSRDLWIQLPTKDLYNTQVMMAAVNAAKDMYDKGQKRLDDFYEKYGDFMSPFSKDMDRYGQLVLGITNPIEDMYAQGIDPLRSAEGRALVNRLVNSFPVQEMNKMKSNANMGYKYLDAMGKLLAEGKYSQEQEKFYLLQAGLPSFEDFSTAQYGEWGRMSPVQEQRLFDLVNPMVKDIKASLLNKDQVESLGYKYNPALDYTGVSEDMLSRAITNGIPGLAGTFGEQFFREKAKQELIANGNVNPTQDEITKQFLKDALTSVSSMLGIREQSVNPIWKAQQDKMNARISAGGRSSGRSSRGGEKLGFTYLGNVVSASWGKALNLSPTDFASANTSGMDVMNVAIRKQREGVTGDGGKTDMNKRLKFIRSNRVKHAQILNDEWANDATKENYYTLNTLGKNLKVQDLKQNSKIIPLQQSNWDKKSIDRFEKNGATVASTGNIVALVMADGRMHTFIERKFKDDETGETALMYLDSGITSQVGNLLFNPDDEPRLYELDQMVNKKAGTTNQMKNDAVSFTDQ